jgi:hypothetical protein
VEPLEWVSAGIVGIIVVYLIIGAVQANRSKVSSESDENIKLSSNDFAVNVHNNNLVTQSGEIIVFQW